jgi:hypothetical protein
MVLIVVGACLCLMPASHAQTCVEPQNLCDQYWDSSGSRWIQNPNCAFVNTTGFLQSDKAASGPSEGLRLNPVGTRCGLYRSSGAPCGVRTTTDTCAEAAGPIFCDPISDPGCCGDPYDPSCGLGDDNYPPCGMDGTYCYYSAPGTGAVEGGAPVDKGSRGALPAPRGSAALEATLRRAVLASPLPGSVSTLVQELARADGVYLRAKLIVSLHGTRTTESYEYWERGAQYRIRLDPDHEFPWTDIAFNGRFLQGKFGEDAVEIRHGDDRFTPLPDGPLALALAPLRVNDPTECVLCQLRVADLKKAAQWRREAPASSIPSETAIATGVFHLGALRTGQLDAEGRLVHFVRSGDKAGEGDGFEVALGNYQPIPGTRAMFPMRLIARLAPDFSLEYLVEKIDLSPTFGDEVFDIYSQSPKLYYGFRDATGSWTGRFVRYTRTPGVTTSCDTKAKAQPKP